MSPRAAWRLESLGFRDVYEYRVGKADWLAAGLPTEGANADVPRIGSYVRTDVPTCRPDEKIGAVTARVRAAEWDMCFVVNEHGILFGRLDAPQLDADPERSVADVMKPGPTTYRPDTAASELFHLMSERGIHKLPVTTSEGKLLGVLLRESLAHAHAEAVARRAEAGEHAEGAEQPAS